MENRLIIFFLVLVLISSGLTYVYFYENKPVTDRIGSVNVSLEIFYNGHQISTGYTINRNGYFFKKGKTLVGGAVLIVAPSNSTYVIRSNNINGQKYYSATKNIKINDIKPYYVSLKLVSPGEIKATSKINKNFIFVNVSSIGYYNDLSYCLNWDANIIYVKSQDKLSKRYFPSYVNCYDIDRSLSNDNYTIKLKFKKWSSSHSNINLFIFDKVFTNETVKYKNIGGKDLSYNIEV